MVFCDEEKLQKLNDFIHPKVIQKMAEAVDLKKEEKYIILDVPIPVQGFIHLSDFIITVIADEDIRIKRCMEKSNMTEEQVKQRIDVQMKNAEYIKLANRIIVNNESRLKLEEAIDKIDFHDLTKKRIGFYAGSFDPFTNGHLDILKKACSYYDKVILGIGVNVDKNVRIKQREEMKLGIEQTLKEEKIENVQVMMYEGLTVNTAIKYGAVELVRGVRSHEEYERESLVRKNNENPDRILEYLKSKNLPMERISTRTSYKNFLSNKGTRRN